MSPMAWFLDIGNLHAAETLARKELQYRTPVRRLERIRCLNADTPTRIQPMRKQRASVRVRVPPHLVVPLVVERVLLEAPRVPAVHDLAHVDQECLPGVRLVGALGGEGVFDLVVRPRHVETRATADLDLGPIVVGQLVPKLSPPPPNKKKRIRGGGGGGVG